MRWRVPAPSMGPSRVTGPPCLRHRPRWRLLSRLPRRPPLLPWLSLTVCPSPLPTLLDPPSGVVAASGEVALTPAESAETAVIFDPYADEGVLRTLHLTGGTDQLALNNLRNIFCMVALRAQTPTHLQAYMFLDQRVEAEESDILARLRELLHGGPFSDEDPAFLSSVFFLNAPRHLAFPLFLWPPVEEARQGKSGTFSQRPRDLRAFARAGTGLPNDAGLPWEMRDIWLQWLDLAYVKNGHEGLYSAALCFVLSSLSVLIFCAIAPFAATATQRDPTLPVVCIVAAGVPLCFLCIAYIYFNPPILSRRAAARGPSCSVWPPARSYSRGTLLLAR